jgi:ABC-type branched-subunit amino acid transport system substrate-binding protein
MPHLGRKAGPTQEAPLRDVRVPLLVVGVLLLTSCGQRLDSGTRKQLLQQSLSGGSSAVTTGGGTAPTTGGGTTGVTAPGTTGVGAPGTSTTGVSAPGTTTTGVSAPGTTTTGPVVSGTAPPEGNGGATDVGVTATTISVGTVADQTGPQPGLFDGDVAGARAYFAYVNSQGGVFGRKISTRVADSGVDCNATSNAYKTLAAASIFSYVSNLSNFDNCGAPVLRANPKIPDVSYALTPEHQAIPQSYSFQPTIPGARVGPARAFAKAFPQTKNAVAGLYADIASAREQWNAEKEMLQANGFTVVYEQATPTTAVDYTQYVIGMRQKKVQLAFLFNTAANNAKVINSSEQQGFHPAVFDAPGTLYDPSLPAAVGNAPTNLYVDTGTALYFNKQEAASIKGVGLYQEWMKRTAPNQPTDQFSVFGWGEAALFVQAVRAAGPKLTRVGLLKALKGIHSADADGLVTSGDPGAKKPQACYLLGHYVKGTWQRFVTPATSFNCDAPYYYKK